MSDGYTDSGDETREAPDPITAQERAAWQAACDAATPGPWPEHITEDGQVWIGEPGDSIAYVGDMETTTGADHHNTAFIAIAREALPRLLAALTACEEREGAARYDQALAEDERDAARDEAAGWRATAMRHECLHQVLLATAESVTGQCAACGTLVPLPPVQPPDPTQPEQLGLLP